MDVLILPGYFGFGGWVEGPGTSSRGVFFRDQAIALARAGHRPVVLYVHFDSTRGVHVERNHEFGVQLVFVHARPWRKMNSIQRILLHLRCAKPSVVGTPEVLHAHVFTALPQAWALSKRLRIPYVITEHSSSVRTGKMSRLWKVIARLGYSRASVVLAVSKPLSRGVQQLYDGRVRIVPNAVRDEFFTQPLANRQGREFQFISVGYGHPNKGWDLLLEAFAILVRQQAQARLTLVGEATSEILERILVLGIGENVSLVGKVSSEEVQKLLANADCHVMPSRVETFGIASIEALAAGLPIIMSNTDAADAIVNPSNGFIVPVGDVDALAVAMSRMIDERGCFVSESIRDAVRTAFSGQALANRLEECYKVALIGEG